VDTSQVHCVTGTVNLDRGTLKAYADAANWLALNDSTSHVYVKDGGATFDTAGYTMGIVAPLEHGGIAAIDGGLTKAGAGLLTLSGLNTYTGPTIVSAGTLSLAQACLYDASNVIVGSGAVLDLASGAADTIHYLLLGGVPEAAGTYDSSNSGGYITGSGSLIVSSSVLPGDANLDGSVDGTDLNIVLSNYGVTSGGTWFTGDFNGDGAIDGTDLKHRVVELRRHFRRDRRRARTVDLVVGGRGPRGPARLRMAEAKITTTPLSL